MIWSALASVESKSFSSARTSGGTTFKQVILVEALLFVLNAGVFR
jgi:hypothetical protein